LNNCGELLGLNASKVSWVGKGFNKTKIIKKSPSLGASKAETANDGFSTVALSVLLQVSWRLWGK